MLGWVGVGLLGAATLIPNALVCAGTREATACFRAFEAPRGAELPWCGDAIDWYSFPSRFPWTVTPATYRGEELRIRIAIGQYENAIAGAPSRAGRAAAAVRIEEAAQIVRTGSRRLAFEELGPAVAAPDPAQDALLLGDRDTLLRHAKEWGEWHARLHTLHAALLEGDFPRALDVARHQATFDPHEEDLRSAVGAILCLGGDAPRGIEMLLHQQDDRASRRYAAMSRNWGDVRTALLACAALGGVTPPPGPATSQAGQDDQREARVPVRLRAVAGHDHRLVEAQESAQQMLSTSLPAGARAPILAALLASGRELSAEVWAELARARSEDGEPPLLDLGTVSIVAWLDVPSDRPIVTGSVFKKAAERLLALAEAASSPSPSPSATDGGSGAPPSPPPADGGSAAPPSTSTTAHSVSEALSVAAGALFIEGARAHVRAAEAGPALELLGRAAPLARLDEVTRALAEAIVRYATGDVEGAHASLAAASLEGASPELRAAALTLRAEVSGVWGPPSPDEANAAFDAAKRTGSAALMAWARRVRLWADPAAEPPAAVSVAALDPMAGRFVLWPSLGYANRQVVWAGADDGRLAILGRNLAVWSAALAAPENDKRAYRYAFLRHRGDMPDALVPYLAVAARLAGEGGDVEVWLDAVMALDAPRFSMRAYAWSRAQAARGRGDHKSHSEWMRRLTMLAKPAGDPGRADLARFLGL